MTKKLVFSVIALAMAVSPFLSVKADNGNWDAAISAAAWNYGDYRVERLAFASDAIGPISLGDYVLVAEPVDSCKPNACDLYNVYMLSDGMKLLMENVPSEALDAHRFAMNDGRFVFVAPTDWNGDHYAVTEYTTDGSATQIVDDVFFSGVEDIDVLTDGENVYFEVAHDYTGNTALDQSGVYVYDAAEGEADIIGSHWEMREEQMLDAADGLVLEKLTFPSGNKQLWIGDTHNVNYLGMTREAIPGTWVDPGADIYAAHFVNDSVIEFFMNYVRHTYDLNTETLTKYDGQFLNWYGAPEDAYQLAGVYLAWVTPENTLMVSDGANVATIGTATGGQFVLEEGRIFYASGSEGKMYDFSTHVTSTIPFVVTDSNGGDIVVGNDAAGNVSYMDLATDQAYDLGYGSAPALADDMHVYWTGVDGNIYEGTVSLPSVLNVGPIRAMKLASDNTVYLIKDGEKSVIPSEKTYFTWFSSWSNVETVSTAMLNRYADGGVASFAPGTKVKLARDSKVYVVGNDGELHWITTQTVAYSIFGSVWNKGIIEINQQDLVTNPFGTALESESDLQTI